MFSDLERALWLAVAISAVVGVAWAFYGLSVWNDFTARLVRLKRLVADLRTIRARRRGVAATVDHHIGHAKHHEQQIASRGARRNRGGSLASDIANGWPAAAAVGTVQQGLGIDVNSRDAENQAQLDINRQAGEYNELLWSIPRGYVARLLGFRPWRIEVSSWPARSKFRRGRSRWHPRRLSGRWRHRRRRP